MTAYRCRNLVTMDSGEFVDGAFVVDENLFGPVGKAADVLPHHHGEVIDLEDVIVLPGLINAHCHLEYSLLRGVGDNGPQYLVGTAGNALALPAAHSFMVLSRINRRSSSTLDRRLRIWILVVF